MIDKEAMKLALEALKSCSHKYSGTRFQEWYFDEDGVKKAVKALEETLASEQEQGEPMACDNCNGSGRMVRDPDIGTDQECFVCEGSGFYEDTTPQQHKPMTDERQVIRSLLGAALGALRYHTDQTRPIQRTNETIAAIEHELAAHGIKE